VSLWICDILEGYRVNAIYLSIYLFFLELCVGFWRLDIVKEIQRVKFGDGVKVPLRACQIKIKKICIYFSKMSNLTIVFSKLHLKLICEE